MYNTYQANIGKDCPGNDIRHTTGIKSAEDCQKLCDQEPTCGAIAWEPSGSNLCWLKTKVGNLVPNSDRDCYARVKHNLEQDLDGTSTEQLSSDVTYLQDMLTKIKDRLTNLRGGSGKDNQQQIVALTEAQESISSALEDRISKLQDQIRNTYTTAQAQSQMLGDVSDDITQKQEMATHQAMTIEQKQALMNTRNRMLELSMEKNIYKRKVIYTILALILAVIVLLVAGYVTFNKA